MSVTISQSPERFIHRWPTARAKEWVSWFVRQARYDRNVIAIVAIGSAVRSRVPSDDLDLFVLCHERNLLRARAPIEIDVRTANVDSVEQEIQAGRDLAVWAVRYGHPLLDRDGNWRRIVDRWMDELPLPDPSISLERARKAQERIQDLHDIGDEDAARELTISYLTHRSWARLAHAGVHPQSRPELPRQLRAVGEADLAATLEQALLERNTRSSLNQNSSTGPPPLRIATAAPVNRPGATPPAPR